MMQWWMFVLIAVGVLAAIVIFFIIVRYANGHKKFKFKIPEVPPTQEEKPKEQNPKEEEFEGLIFDEEVSAPQQNIKDDGRFAMEDFNLEDEDFDAEAEKRYQDFLARHNKIEKMFEENKKPKQKQVDEFEEFRNQFCYSKYVTDSVLAQKLKNLSPQARKIMLDDLFKEISGENFDIKI